MDSFLPLAALTAARHTLLVRIVATAVALWAFALVAVAGAAPSPRPTVLGMVVADGTQTLTRLDAATLAPLAGPTVTVVPTVGRGLRSPDRSLLVFAANSAPSLTFVDVDRMQAAEPLTVAKAGTAELIAWPEQRRLYAFAWGCCPVRTDVLIIDPVDRKIVARVPLRGTAVSEAASADGVAVLTSPVKGIGPANLLTVNHEGTARRAAVVRIRAGSKWRTVNFQPVGTIRQPGFAVDPSGRTGYVVDASGLVAQVDLSTLAVSYRASRTFARADKQVSGPMRRAQWIGNGRIAVSGINAKLTKTRTGWKNTWAPAGLTLIDTRSWESRLVDARASWFVPRRDAILVVSNGNLTAYNLDGAARYRVPVASTTAFVEAYGDYAYVWEDKTVRVLDASSGAVVATMPKPSLWLVSADS